MASPEWQEALSRLERDVPGEIAFAATLEDVEVLRVDVLGRKGRLTDILRSLKDQSPGDKKVYGPIANNLKLHLEGLFDAKASTLKQASLDAELNRVAVDLSLPGPPFPSGHLHPLTLTLRRVTGILERLGFGWADGPHVETDYFNFEALNIPPEHPARDLQDTFYARLTTDASAYIPGPHPHPAAAAVLRTHTSPVQIRSMLQHAPKGVPLRIMAPGRVFRHEAVDATHSAVFHQIEGLYIDHKVSLADLKGTLQTFMRELFGSETKIRFIPSYFPFVEPGVQVDVSCAFCNGSGACSVCKGSRFIELLGAGLVHPNVLRAGGYDPAKWSGFAFGVGIERLALMLFGVNDIRTFYENDLRFLEQF